ncbi:N-acetyltransferase [Sulfurimonas sp. HSL1-2]|uniref:GNAT family N-acetyltransferase n=1 Tax=Thiomicrolovo zhangzhouensis TaxID=3131933 RepID=UPI0031F96C42
MSGIRGEDPSPDDRRHTFFVRPAVAADTAALTALETTVFSADNYPLSRRAFYYHIRQNLLLVACTDDGTVAGYILTLIRRRVPKIYSLAVAPGFRNRGVAAKLLEQALHEAALRGFEHMTLEVRSDSPAAIALYRRYGFETLRTLNAFYRDGCDAYLMQR